ncbi:MAG: polyphosphate kinase 2 [Alphaproteobacteria bacterium]|nr:polyphosphate kinase 2 [Alphaproteobacteria bacterium]
MNKHFDIEDPSLPEWIDGGAFTSGGYPYAKRLKRSEYETTLRQLQVELVKLQSHLQATGERVVVVFEGRDAAGKGGTIKNYLAYLNPRHNRIVALTKPTETERTQWYFQRYVAMLPSAGEQVLFDRSWYNRAGVEPVMGYCTPEETELFLDEVPRFEHMLIKDGIRVFKFWLSVGREMQLKRFHSRRHDPLRVWKLSPIDLKAISKWEAYTEARDAMLARTDSDIAPWWVVRANDKRRARINVIRRVLDSIEYDGRDLEISGATDENIIIAGARFAQAGHVQE